MATKYKSNIARAVHRAAKDSARAGVMDKQTMREFDVLCLSKVPDLTADEIRAIRDRTGVSQSVFAAYLNVTTNLVSKWERGLLRPTAYQIALMRQFQATADAKKDQAHEQVKNLLVGAGVVAALVWLLNAKG